jgi:hypothetical protein
LLGVTKDNADVVIALSSCVTALVTCALAAAAFIQLPLIAGQLRALSKQIELTREADRAAERRLRERDTMSICQRYDFDPIIDAATQRIWVASEGGTDYRRPEVERRDLACLLNYFDGVCIGIDQGLYIEEIVKDHLSEMFKHAVEFLIGSGKVDKGNFLYLLKYYDKWFPATNKVAYRTEH